MNDAIVDTTARRALRAVMDNQDSDLTTEEISARTGVSRTSIVRMRAILRLQPKIRERIESGELQTVADAGYAAGLPTYVNSRERRHGAPGGRVFSKGDNFSDVFIPLERYLEKWQSFPHLAPREAKRRLEIIANVEAALAVTKRDLEQRSEKAWLTYGRT